MLHTLSHQWPTPSEPVITDPVTFKMKAKSEAERRRNYFLKVKSDVLTPIIESCLHNIPKNRLSIVTICDQVGSLVEKQNSPTDNIDLSLFVLKQEMDAKIKNKDIQVQLQAAEIEALRSDMAKLQVQIKNPLSPKAVTISRQVNN